MRCSTSNFIPIALAATPEAQIFGTSNGIPPTSGVNLINNAAPGGPKEERVSTADQDLDGALCLRIFKSNRDAGLLLFAGLLVDAVMRSAS